MKTESSSLAAERSSRDSLPSADSSSRVCRRISHPPMEICCAWATPSRMPPTGRFSLEKRSRGNTAAGHHLVSRHGNHQSRHHRKLGARRRLSPIAERSVRRLAIIGRRVRCDAANVLTRGVETAPGADADHAAHVRGRLDRHRSMDRSATEPRARGGGHLADRPVRGVLRL